MCQVPSGHENAPSFGGYRRNPSLQLRREAQAVESLGQGCTASKGLAQRVGTGASGGRLGSGVHALHRCTALPRQRNQGTCSCHDSWNMEMLRYKPRSDKSEGRTAQGIFSRQRQQLESRL